MKTPEGRTRIEKADERINEALARDYEKQQAREQRENAGNHPVRELR